MNNINKKCSRCLEILDLSEFSKSSKGSRNKDGLRSHCKKCRCLDSKEYSIKNKEKISCFQKEYRNKNKEKIKKNNTIYRQNNLVKIKEKTKQWNLKNKNKIKEQKKTYYQNNKEKIKKHRNKVHVRQRIREYDNERRKNPQIKIGQNMSRSIRYHINKRNNQWETLVGYSIDDLMKNLQNKFKEGMIWENYGEWEIDHIRPISSFNFKTIEDEDFKKCWALENLQPLWRHENRRKFNNW